MLKILKLILCVLLTTSSFSCKKANQDLLICGINDPLNNLKWLNAEFKSIASTPQINAIVLFDYNGNQVVEIQKSLSSSTNQSQYNCDGIKIDFNNTSDFNNYKQNRKELKVLFGTKIWN